VRRYDPNSKLLTLSEELPPRSRNFQLTHQVGLLTQGAVLDRIARDENVTTDDSRTLARVALANYFAAAVLMPYKAFYEAARAERYDIELLGHRFRCSFEQIAQRMTTLRRPGAEGVPFHFLRIDIAGNISKRFTASGIRFARFAGACPRWNIHTAFLTPGRINVQLSRMSEGETYFCVARTVRHDAGGYHAQHTVQAIGLGCRIDHAKELVYADGIDLGSPKMTVPVGVTCRLCERMDCEQRVFPPMQHQLRVDENVRGVSFYAPATVAR
jgi:predicted transcriptional regulator